MALRETTAPIVAISPLVAGKPIKGPADRLLGGLGIDVSAFGVAGLYRDFLDTFVIDTQDFQQKRRLEELGISVIVTDTIMSDMEKSIALAQVVVGNKHTKCTRKFS
jgi:LPPG:FO 2-phospho-L-lactate transferase